MKELFSLESKKESENHHVITRFDPNHVCVIHDTIFEDTVNIFFTFGSFISAQKSEKIVELIKMLKPKMIKTWTRFNKTDNEDLGLKTKFEDGDRYLFYYRPDYCIEYQHVNDDGLPKKNILTSGYKFLVEA